MLYLMMHVFHRCFSGATQEPHVRTIHYFKVTYLLLCILNLPRTLPPKHPTLCIFITSYSKKPSLPSLPPPFLLLLRSLNQPHSLIRNILTNPPTPQHNSLVLKYFLRSLPPPQPHLFFLTEHRFVSSRVVGATVAIVIVAAAPAIAETVTGVLGCRCWVG